MYAADQSAHPNIKVIVLTTFDDDEYVQRSAVRRVGYLLKGVSVADLTNAVRESGCIAPDVASKALQMFARMAKATSPSVWTKKQTEDLQDNEWRIIREVGAGLSNKGNRGRALFCPKARCATIWQHSQQAGSARPHAACYLGGADRRSRPSFWRSAMKGLAKRLKAIILLTAVC